MSDRTTCEYKKLGKVAELIAGSTPSRTRPEYYASSAGLPWAKIENLDQGEIFETKEYLSRQGAALVKRIPKGAVLVSVIGTIGKIGLAGRELAANQQILAVAFRPESGILPKYGYYYLKFCREKLKKIAYSAVEKRISAGQLEEYVLPMPDLERQQEIISVMEKLECYEKQQKEKLALAQEYEERLSFSAMLDVNLYRAGVCARELCSLYRESVQQTGRLCESTLWHVFAGWEKDKNGKYLRQEQERETVRRKDVAGDILQRERMHVHACSDEQGFDTDDMCGEAQDAYIAHRMSDRAVLHKVSDCEALQSMKVQVSEQLETYVDEVLCQAAGTCLDQEEMEQYLAKSAYEEYQRARENSEFLMRAAFAQYVCGEGKSWFMREWHSRT